ncbi:tail fiber protein [Edwardsiella ictaluri]|uniref:tail fiber protein n=1 Tax=Edwardsiella ictaluri TaxID=67780 RepID=UPI003784B9AB
MADYRGYVTAAGQAFEALAKQMNYPVTIGFIEVGDGRLPDSDSPIARTRLVNKLKSFPAVVEQDLKNPGQWLASINIPADDSINGAGYFIREIGCKLINQGDGVLYAYRRVSDDWKPVITSGEAKSFIYKLRFIPSNGELLTPTIDPSVVLVDREGLDLEITKHERSRNHPDATLDEKGFVQLIDSVSSDSTKRAATANAVRYTYQIATRRATTTQAGQVQLENNINSTSTTNAPTCSALKRVYNEATRRASTGTPGQVQLQDNIDSTSLANAPTSNALKRVYEHATRRATTTRAGQVQLENNINSTSTTNVPTCGALRDVYDEATRAATTTRPGQVQLEDSVSSTSSARAPTCSALKRTYDEATRRASTGQAGQVQLEDSVSSTSTRNAPTCSALKRTYDEATRAATTTRPGQVQLEDSVSSTSTTRAPTAYAVKKVNERVNKAAVGQRTLLFSGNIGNGNISLSQSPSNFDEIIIFSTDDNSWHAAIDIKPIWLITEIVNRSLASSISIRSMDGTHWSIITRTFLSTLWEVSSESSRILLIYGVNYT